MKKILKVSMASTACVIGIGIIIGIAKDTPLFCMDELLFTANRAQAIAAQTEEAISYNEPAVTSDNIEYSDGNEADKAIGIDDKMLIKPNDTISPQIVIIPGNTDIDPGFSLEPEEGK